MRLWSVWLCFTAALLNPAHEAGARSETPTEPERLTDLYFATREARLAGDHKTWLERAQRLLLLAPEHPDPLISLARALAANGRFDEAMAHLEDAVRRGAGFDLTTFPELESAPDSPRLRAARDQALRNMAPVAAPEVFLALPAGLQPEGITWDPVGRFLYIGSMNGEIWRVSLDGTLARFAGPGSGLREVLGLKVDVERRLLWAATAVFEDDIPTGQPKEGLGTSGLHAYHLDTGERVRACELDERPTLHGFNDLALARDGQVYVSDSPTGSIYKLSASGCQLERLLQDPTMTYPNGLALTPDGSRLYVGHVEGLSAIDLSTGQRIKLPLPQDAAVGSIDGMAWDGNDLLAIQNHPLLHRVARIKLADDGLSIRRVTTMSSRPPQGLIMTTGVAVGDAFYIAAGLQPVPQEASQSPRPWHILRSRVR